jgi:hypothetical protein
LAIGDEMPENWMTKSDQNLAQGVKISIDNALGNRGKPIPIQFPPRILSETKNPSWEEKPIYSYEPIAIFKGSEARKLNVELKYVVTSPDGEFCPDKIANICRTIKSYAYNIGSESEKAFPTISVSWPYILPDGAKCRMTDFNIEYSETLVGGTKEGFFPLVSIVTFTLHVVTKIGGLIPFNQLQGGKKANPKQEGPELPLFIKFQWM